MKIFGSRSGRKDLAVLISPHVQTSSQIFSCPALPLSQQVHDYFRNEQCCCNFIVINFVFRGPLGRENTCLEFLRSFIIITICK